MKRPVSLRKQLSDEGRRMFTKSLSSRNLNAPLDPPQTNFASMEQLNQACQTIFKDSLTGFENGQPFFTEANFDVNTQSQLPFSNGDISPKPKYQKSFSDPYPQVNLHNFSISGTHSLSFGSGLSGSLSNYNSFDWDENQFRLMEESFTDKNLEFQMNQRPPVLSDLHNNYDSFRRYSDSSVPSAVATQPQMQGSNYGLTHQIISTGFSGGVPNQNYVLHQRASMPPFIGRTDQIDNSVTVGMNKKSHEKTLNAKKKKNRGHYKCGLCGQIKANHKCPFETGLTRNVDVQVDNSSVPTKIEKEKVITVRKENERPKNDPSDLNDAIYQNGKLLLPKPENFNGFPAQTKSSPQTAPQFFLSPNFVSPLTLRPIPVISPQQYSISPQQQQQYIQYNQPEIQRSFMNYIPVNQQPIIQQQPQQSFYPNGIIHPQYILSAPIVPMEGQLSVFGTNPVFQMQQQRK